MNWFVLLLGFALGVLLMFVFFVVLLTFAREEERARAKVRRMPVRGYSCSDDEEEGEDSIA
jgi:hypothetical protein